MPNSSSALTTPHHVILDRFHFNFNSTSSTSTSLTSSPILSQAHFRAHISSAMPAIADDLEDLENLTIGDDDVLVMPDPSPIANAHCK